MPKPEVVSEDTVALSFLNRKCDANSPIYHVPKDSVVVLLPGGQQHKLYDDKRIMHEGEWTLNGVSQDPPVFTYEKEHGFQIKADGMVVIQGLGGGDFVESHLHRWAPNANGLRCVHVYGDGVSCDSVALYGAVESWGSRYYQKSLRKP